MTNQPNIFQEIEEDLERQRMEALWRRFGPYIIALALAIVLATAAITSWRSWKTEHQQAATDGLISILAKGDASKTEETKALEAFAAANSGTSQAMLAQLYGAGAVAKDDKAKSVTLYDAVANDEKADIALRQFAILKSVEMQMDSADPAALRARLKPLWADNAPWRYSALEDEGHLALKAGDRDGARQAFSTLAHDAAAPRNMSDNAAEMLRFIGE